MQEMELHPMSCDTGTIWEDGEKVTLKKEMVILFIFLQVLSYIKEVEYFGLTGEITFDAEGFRTNFQMDLMDKFHHRMKKSAIWTEKGG